MMSKPKIAIFCAVLICAAVVVWLFIGGERFSVTATYSEFLKEVQSGQVSSVIVAGANSGAVQATYKLKEGKIGRTILPRDYRDALLALQDKMVNIEIRDSGALRPLVNMVPFLLLLAIWVVLMIRRFPNGFKPGVWG